MPEKKLEKQHVEQINQLQTKFNENNTEIALVTKEIYKIEQHVDQLHTYKNQLLDQYAILDTQERKLIEELKTHYGEGQIDLVQGIFISEQ